MNTETFDTVVVGAGALGASVAYQLMREGQQVALLDGGAPGAETSRRAAGMAMQLQADDMLSPIARLGISKLMNFEAETGQPLEVFQPGSIKVARTPADEAQLHTEVERGKALGLQIELVSPDRAHELAPWFCARDVRAMWYAPLDAYLEPGDLPRAYAAALRAGGATVRDHTRVIEIGVSGGHISHVATQDAKIRSGSVVLAAGAWTPVLAGWVGMDVPMWPIRHQLFITHPIDGVTNAQPAIRLMDIKSYTRPCHGGLMFGAYEPDPLLMDVREAPAGFGIGNLPLAEEPLREKRDAVTVEFPSLANAEWSELRGGLPTMTPDGHFLAGPLEPLTGLWMIGGDNVGGLSTSPALGEHLADWITTGHQPEALRPFHPGRFGDRYRDRGRLREACRSTYVDKYSDEEVTTS
jgi:glycine/D-amino acid oxidase-like deaminating enzyme